MKEFNTQPSGRQTLVRILGTLVALVLLVYVLSQQGWPEIVAAFRLIAPWRLSLAMALMIISRFAVSGRWYVLLRSGGINISFRQGLRINFAGLFANNFMPTTVGGDVIRLAGALQLGFDAAVSTASLVVDRLVGMAGMALALPFGLPRILQIGVLPSNSFLQPHGFLAGISIPFLGKWGVQAWEKGTKILQKLFSALSIWLKQPRALLLGLVLTFIHMFCLFGVLALLYNGMEQAIPFWLTGGLYSIVYFVTLIPFSVNGYGLQELSMTLIFSTFGGVSLSSGITAALLFRTLMMLASLPGVLFIPGMLAEIRLRRPSAG
jgi:uncharacterized membrane protein YbhN (UPF0104 family)